MIRVFKNFTPRGRKQINIQKQLDQKLYDEVKKELRDSLNDEKREYEEVLKRYGHERYRAKLVNRIYTNLKNGHEMNDLESLLVGLVRVPKNKNKNKEND